MRRHRRGDGPPRTPRRTPSTRSTSPGARSPPRRSGGGPAGLTARETQVLRLIADGATTREISEQLFISAKTADNHIQHIYTKLGVTNRAAATRWALDHGVVEPATADAGRPHEMGTRNEEISSCAATARRQQDSLDPADQRWETRDPIGSRRTKERHDDPGNDEGQGPRPVPGGVRHDGRRQARLARVEGLHASTATRSRRTGSGRSSTGTRRAGRRSPPTRRPPASCRRPATWAGRPSASTSAPSPPRPGVPGSVASRASRSSSGNQMAISRSADSGASEPWTRFCWTFEAPVAAEVAADRARERPPSGRWRRPATRKPSMTRSPSTTIATTGPESMNSTSGS